jgi:hypothetical protein
MTLFRTCASLLLAGALLARSTGATASTYLPQLLIAPPSSMCPHPVLRSPLAPTVSGGIRLAQWGRPLAYGCCTNVGRCPLQAPQVMGSPCACFGPYGPVYGYAC